MEIEPSNLIYQDPNILIINKPSGLLSVPDGYDPDLLHLRSVLEPIYGELWMVHRLDKETSGVMVLARNQESHRTLNEMFRKRKVNKVYHCLVHPKPEWTSLEIQLPLQVDADRKHRTRVNTKHGKPARSLCKVKKSLNCGALLEIRIDTGITHQIRAHLREFNFGIFGDKLYSAGLLQQPEKAQRMMLHARSLSFPDLQTAKMVEFSATYPEDFREFYTTLRMTKALDEGF